MASKKSFIFTPTGEQYIDDVGRQLEKIFNKTNKGSIASRRRYFEACERFIKEIVPQFKLKKLANIQDKHLEYYALQKLAQNGSAKYIKTDLAAIRYLHHITPHAKHELTASKKFNKELELKSTPDGRNDRAWTDTEIADICEIARVKDKVNVADMIEFTVLSGCRLDEVATLRRHHLERALREGKIALTNTKGGRPRQVPVSGELRAKIEELLPHVERGEYVFVPENMKVHIFKRQAQDFLVKNRGFVQSDERQTTGHNLKKGEKGALTWHGLRHTFAQNFYSDMREKGYSDQAARQKLTEVLGHGRIEITYVYVPRNFSYRIKRELVNV